MTLSRTMITLIGALLMATLLLGGCGRPAPNTPDHLGQLHH